MNDDVIDDSASAPVREADLVKRPLRKGMTRAIPDDARTPVTAMPMVEQSSEDDAKGDLRRRREEAVAHTQRNRAMGRLRRFVARGTKT